MPIKLTCNNIEINANTILWDRDSYFIDFSNYWSRLIGTIAQKIAEHTTDNWGKFNLVRTEVIKLLGIHPETSNAIAPSSPTNILSVSLFPSLITTGLRNLLTDKNPDDYNFLITELITKSLQESQVYIKDSVIKSNLEILKNINKQAKQFIVTNDSKENNSIFLQESGILDFIENSYFEANKEHLSNICKENFVFITQNSYLHKSYMKRERNNVLLIDNLKSLVLNNTSQDELITINIDGASRGNPGPASIGIVFKANKEIIKEISECIGNKTNNHAEYTALIKALEICRENSFNNVEIKSDSELVVNQMNRKYKVKDADIKELFDKANSLMQSIPSCKIFHIRREENLKADKLANIALDKVRNY